MGVDGQAAAAICQKIRGHDAYYGITGNGESLQTFFFLVHREWLWTFVQHQGIEPTTNTAERALRPAVIYRNLSFRKSDQ